MPTEGTGDSQRTVSRRKYVQAAIAAGMTGIAGCSGDPGDPTPTSGDGADDGSGGGADGEDGTGGDTQDEPVTSRYSSYTNNSVQEINFNYFSTTGSQGTHLFFEEFWKPIRADNSAHLMSGEMIESPWIEDYDEIEIPTVVKDFRIEPPFDRYFELDDRLTYWDGTPIDAEAVRNHRKIFWYRDNDAFDDSVTFNGEIVDDYTYHEWRNKGDAPGQQEDPTNEVILESNMLQSEVPIHPDFTTEWYEKLEGATTSSEAEDILSELDNRTIDFTELAENQWGSGLYRLPAPDEDVFDESPISNERILLTKWDEHPNEHAEIETVQVDLANPDRQKILAGEGEVSAARGIITPTGGKLNRTVLPDYMQQISKAERPGEDQLMFNWNNEHLENLWVRRAIVAALDWPTITANGWTTEQMKPSEHHVGLPDSHAEEWFSDEFLDQIHSYPMEADVELANEWMERAGYSKQNGVWTSPDGNSISFEYITFSPLSSWVNASQTITPMLQDFGFEVNFRSLDGPSWEDALRPENLNYDLSLHWSPSAGAHNFYWTDGTWGVDPLVHGDPNDSEPWQVDPESTGESTTHDTKDLQNMPLEVPVPSEIGSIEAPDEAGRVPDLTDAETIDVADLIYKLRAPDTDEDQFRQTARKCARFYNFYVPDWCFQNTSFGLVGNVRDYDWPAYDNLVTQHQHPDQADFVVESGIVRPSYNQEYPEPGTRGE